ncbi:recombination regulator RecX [Herbaspirillum rhizosphaerae]|uniref:recombination regulator RecX n=1 Tax=Herbaspirillum rhizosphaerae TaxID=346179 RepID=UPI00067DAB6E|nr:recombination regulator RecX [Herbaspirillum rhizosphaerae]
MPRPQLSLKARALKYLSSREHSRLELARKLTPYAQDDDDIEALLNWLQESKFLSQERFSESLVHRRAGRYGNNRILSELKSHGIDGEALGDAKLELAQGETQRAREVLSRKYAEAPTDAGERAKCMRFLQQRGFSHRAIQVAVKTAWNEVQHDDD